MECFLLYPKSFQQNSVNLCRPSSILHEIKDLFTIKMDQLSHRLAIKYEQLQKFHVHHPNRLIYRKEISLYNQLTLTIDSLMISKHLHLPSINLPKLSNNIICISNLSNLPWIWDPSNHHWMFFIFKVL